MYEVSIVRPLPKRGQQYQNTKNGDTYDITDLLPAGTKPPGFAINANNNGKCRVVEAQVLYTKGGVHYYRNVDEFMGVRYDDRQKAYVLRFLRAGKL